MEKIEGNIVDVFREVIFPGVIWVEGGTVVKIEENDRSYQQFICPGLVDAHVHIESTMLTPAQFSRLVVPRGTIAVVTDPHEIANVLGIEGVEYMIESASHVPLKCFFGAPSCVPATAFESSGAVLGSQEVEHLLDKPEVFFLSEMMNFPGVIHGDKEVLKKIEAARKRGLPVDGHAPGLMGEELKIYAGAGITTDHECFSLAEALEKIECGMKIQIREGSAARNFEALIPLFDSHAESLMLCTDDIHPDELLKQGHIDRLIRKGLQHGIDLFKLLRAASVTPVLHYSLPVGLLREGDPADFIVVSDLKNFQIEKTFIGGQKVFDRDQGLLFESGDEKIINRLVKRMVSPEELEITMPTGNNKVRGIQCFDGDLVTDAFWFEPTLTKAGKVTTDVENDILKIVVVDRYRHRPPAIGFIRGFELKRGALATSVAHDSHNVVAVGTSDQEIANAINLIMEGGGGMVAVDDQNSQMLPLPVAGLMSHRSGEEVAQNYARVEKMAHNMGARLAAPFMTLSFMSLLVIPKLKIGDQGLFDVTTFSFASLFE